MLGMGVVRSGRQVLSGFIRVGFSSRVRTEAIGGFVTEP